VSIVKETRRNMATVTAVSIFSPVFLQRGKYRSRYRNGGLSGKKDFRQ
jgi:hypothetical protein